MLVFPSVLVYQRAVFRFYSMLYIVVNQNSFISHYDMWFATFSAKTIGSFIHFWSNCLLTRKKKHIIKKNILCSIYYWFLFSINVKCYCWLTLLCINISKMWTKYVFYFKFIAIIYLVKEQSMTRYLYFVYFRVLILTIWLKYPQLLKTFLRRFNFFFQ